MSRLLGKKTYVWALTFVVLPLVAAAQDIDCNNQQSTVEMKYCAWQSYEAADEDLNVSYQNAMQVLRDIDVDLPENLSGGAEVMRAAQRAWITFRDKACEAQGFTYRGGTLEPVIVTYCLEDLTRQRDEQLRQIWEEN